MQVGDKVKMQNYGVIPSDVEYTILAIEEDFIKVKHPEIGGYFHFSKDKVETVIPQTKQKK